MRSTLTLCLLAVCVAGMAQQDSLPSPEAPRASVDAADAPLAEQAGYCIGLDLGRRLREDEAPVDLAGLVAGLRDGLGGAKPQLTDEQVEVVMQQFQSLMQQKAEKKMAPVAEANLARGEKYLAANRAKEGVQETKTGLQYRVLTEGKGATPGPRDTVRCHYEGKLVTGEVFDSSYKRGEPAEFPVDGVIAGWTEALQMMKAGSKWEVVLPAKIAYGERGAPGAIGPNETLVFQIELLDVVD